MIKIMMARPRLSALLLLAAAIGLLGFGLIWPAAGHVSAQYHEQERYFDRVARARARASELKVVTAAVNATGSDLLWQHAYRDATAAVAIGRFDSDARAALGTDGSQAVIEKLPLTASGGLTELAARIRLSIPADRLADCLERIERSPKLIRIRSLKVESPLAQRDDRNELLDVTLEVVGYWIEASVERRL